MVNYNTHLAPGFTLNVLVPTPANVVVLQGLLGPLLWGGCTASIKCPLLPKWPKTSLSAPGDSPFPPEQGVKWWNFRLGAPPVYRVLMEFKPFPFSFLPFFFPCGCFHSSSFQLLSSGGGDAYSVFSPISILSPQAKTSPCPPQLLSPPVHLSTPRIC